MSTGWINVSPGVSAQVEYEDYEYQMNDSDTMPAKLTGNLIILKSAVSNWDTPLYQPGEAPDDD